MTGTSPLKHEGKILIVDDSTTNRFLLRSILSAVGYEVDECEDGVECLEYCRDNAPAMILLDIMMPRMDGIEVCRRLREDYSRETLPVMMVSTKSEQTDLALSLEAGANDYVTKPIDRKIFLARLETSLALARSQRMIQEQRHSLEQALRIQNAFGDALPDAIAVFNGQGEVVYSNLQLRQMCGGVDAGSREEVFSSLLRGSLQEECRRQLKAFERYPDQNIEVEISTKGSKRRVIRLVSRPVALHDEEQLRLWIWRDLTEMRELEERIAQQVKLDMVSVFAVGMAHNFNNLLGSILGANELLRRSVGGDRRGERCLGIIEQAVSNGMKLTKKMAALVRHDIEQGPDEDDAGLANLMNIVVSTQSALVDERVGFEVDIPSALPPLALNSTNLLEIFTNIVANALDATTDNGVVQIAARLCDDASRVKVSISDNGCGMDRETLDKVFEPFFTTKNLDQEHKVSVEGNGLGMWNVYNLLKMSGGDIEIESSPGKGTRVDLYIPVQDSTN